MAQSRPNYSGCLQDCVNCGIPAEMDLGTPDVDDKTIATWQRVVDNLARIARVPAALIMRLDEEFIEVFVASDSEGNPYSPGDKEHWQDSGLYCEHVVKTRSKLAIIDAKADASWAKNPDIKLNMISYLGFPIVGPRGDVFGTVCVLNSSPTAFPGIIEDLLLDVKELVESHLRLLCQGDILSKVVERLNQKMSELDTLRGFLTICSGCKRVKISEESWQAIEAYVTERSEAQFTHAICTDCRDRLYSDLDQD